MSDTFGIVANVISDRVLRTGAKVWIGYPHWPCVVVRGLSKGGRTIAKFIHMKRLENFRAAWMPEHIRDLGGYYALRFDKKSEPQEAAQAWAAHWLGVRSFRSDGAMVRDGITEGEAAARAWAARSCGGVGR